MAVQAQVQAQADAVLPVVHTRRARGTRKVSCTSFLDGSENYCLESLSALGTSRHDRSKLREYCTGMITIIIADNHYYYYNSYSRITIEDEVAPSYSRGIPFPDRQRPKLAF